jgi:hypothetical protein
MNTQPDEKKTVTVPVIVDTVPTMTLSSMMSNMNSEPKYVNYSVFHVLMSFLALYLTYRCKKATDPIDWVQVLFAACCPYFYIMFILITRGTCGLLEKQA